MPTIDMEFDLFAGHGYFREEQFDSRSFKDFIRGCCAQF
jgi:hypothetical protein